MYDRYGIVNGNMRGYWSSTSNTNGTTSRAYWSGTTSRGRESDANGTYSFRRQRPRFRDAFFVFREVFGRDFFDRKYRLSYWAVANCRIIVCRMWFGLDWIWCNLNELYFAMVVPFSDSTGTRENALLLYSVHFTLFICYPVLAGGPVL